MTLIVISPCFRLPVPWFLYTICFGQPVPVTSAGMVCSITLLFCMLMLVFFSILLFNWKMTKGKIEMPGKLTMIPLWPSNGRVHVRLLLWVCCGVALADLRLADLSHWVLRVISRTGEVRVRAGLLSLWRSSHFQCWRWLCDESYQDIPWAAGCWCITVIHRPPPDSADVTACLNRTSTNY